jgi:hypothetical protein
MADVFSFITTHWADIVALGAAAHGMALIIINLTPTPADNAAYAKFYKFIEVLAGVVTKIAKK